METKFTTANEQNFSPTENVGIAAMPTDARTILSVGISTGGVAEMRMAQLRPDATVVATTLDSAGLHSAQETIAIAGLTDRIEAKIEDVSEPLPYPDNHFDYIYARLVLHYLSKQQLDTTLIELKRVLKQDHQIFIVVRSTSCPDASSTGAAYDPETGFTSYQHPAGSTNREVVAKRYFHTEDSITEHVTRAGLNVEYVRSRAERLFLDFMRTVISPNTDDLIELLATKENAHD